MPELPEVEVTRQGIAPDLVGRRVAGTIVRVPALRYPVPEDLDARLAGKVLASIGRRGKYLLLDFGSGTLMIHLGMSGTLRLLPPATPPEKHDHIDLLFGPRSRALTLRYRDPRRFGAFLWIEGPPDGHPLLASLGIEPLDPAFDGAWLHRLMKGATLAIKPALMDSHRLVGVGNIYASESLFRAGIAPMTPAGKLSRQRCDRLASAIRQTLQDAIVAGGSSLRDFRHSDGNPGYFQLQSAVYGRAGAPCRQCGRPIREIRQGQRATFFCPRCQR